MPTIITNSAEHSEFARYSLASRCLTEYFQVSSGAKVEVEIIGCTTDMVQAGRMHSFVSDSGLANVAWVTNHDYVQKKTVFVLSLGNVALALKRPLPISLEVSVTNVIAYSYDLDELAVSESESEALDEIRVSIVETYFLLKSEQEKLGPLQRRHWEFLKQIISEV